MKAIQVSTDRAVGTVLGSACGDALGAGYEFGDPLPPDAPIAMIGGGPFGFAPGEWTDDTSMAIPIVETINAGLELTSRAGLDSIADGWFSWLLSGPRDIGNQTSAVLNSSTKQDAAGLREASRWFALRNPRSAGNGSLMRTAPVALADLEPRAVAEGAAVVSELTHADPTTCEACQIWSLAIAHAIEHQNFDGVHLALDYLPQDRAVYWRERLQEAETRPASSFVHNGWVVEALQTAWAVIIQTPVPTEDPPHHLSLALRNAVRAGHDTDTVACIAGGLLGARWGEQAIPVEWLEPLHGWPGYGADELRHLVLEAGEQPG